MLDDVRSIWATQVQEWETMKESFTHFSAFCKLANLVEGDVDSLANFLQKYREHQNRFTLKVFYDFDESIEFSNTTSEDILQQRFTDLRNEIEGLDGEEELSVSLSIYKSTAEPKPGVLVDQVYSVESLSSYLEGKSLVQVHSEIVARYGETDTRGVAFLGDFEYLSHTEFFYFVPKNQFSVDSFDPKFNKTSSDEAKRIRGTLAHFSNASEWPFSPGHFKFLGNKPRGFKVLSDIYNGLLNAYLISFLANLTSINNESIEYQLKGLKDISACLDFDALVNSDSSYLWVLFKWVYAGNSVDKLGVTRNVIPLHVEDLLSVDESVLASAYSSFILSQKDDVKSYIDATSKLADQIQATTQKAGDVAEKVANSIKTGVFGLATFAISTILFRIFSKGGDIHSYSDLFAFIGSPLFVSMIVFALIIFSALFGLALFESFQDQARFKEMYDQSKKTYENVLTTEDMKNILSDDEYFKKNDVFISGRRTFYIWIWISVLFVISTTLIIASCYAMNISG
ncbi:hypothetical protein [Vibrio barjaei]|uniref:hypothetical protein n=1 Tax=Vibrio barjaei TaxID=1676683 RepID=UPI0007BB1324|nr:hypothetical protein [Vibrio barjaei]OIN27404.1 hypothetical protein AWH66_2011940 [Vibrio barjaei]